jgi:UDP-glucose 4-epimerase
MRCLVIGGSGFIGGHLVQKLSDAGHDVAVLDLHKPKQNVAWFEHDVRSDLGGMLEGFDFVYHLAAVANARKASEYPELAFSTGVIGTLNVLRASLRAGVERVVLASSSWVAGAQVGSIVDEYSPFNLMSTNTVYGVTKLSQELICYGFKEEYGGPSYTILRYGVPYGEGMWRGLVVRSFMDMAEHSGVINIMGDGKQYREFLYVGDMCEAQVLALKPIASDRVYNLTGDKPVTVDQLAAEVIRHFPARIEYTSQARIEPKLKRIKNGNAKKDLGWTIETTLEEGVAKCVGWWRSLDEDEKQEEYRLFH